MSQMIVILLIIHGAAMIAAGQYLWRHTQNHSYALAIWLILSFFPVGGAAVVLIIKRYQPLQQMEVPDPAREAAIEDALANPKVVPLDVQTETNVASLQDVLLVADFDQRRKVLLDIMKTDALVYSKYMHLALENEDTETAHYAASGLQYIRQKLDARLRSLKSIYFANPDNYKAAAEYADMIDQYLTCFRLDSSTRLQYLHESINILSKLVETRELIWIRRLIENLLIVGQYQQARQYCWNLLDEYADSEAKYLILMKSFFLMKDKDHFDQVFRRFRDSSIGFSTDALNITRLWLGVLK
jgi:hypothetical protein